MKKNYILLTALAASVGFFSFQHTSIAELGNYNSNIHKQSGGGQPGLTGAPGENDCTGCHQGTVQDGSNENSLIILEGLSAVSEYVGGTTYLVNLDMSSDPGTSGFSATALDGTAAMAGTLTGNALGSTQDFTNGPGTRAYVSHISSTSPTSGIWSWNWTAPAAGTGDVTFYIATNAANGNGAAGPGDVIYLSTHTISEMNASIEENTFEHNFKAGYSISNREIVVDFNANTIGNMVVNLVDMNGRSVYTEKLGSSELGENSERVRLPQEIDGGMYVVHFFIGNKAMSANIMVQ